MFYPSNKIEILKTWAKGKDYETHERKTTYEIIIVKRGLSIDHSVSLNYGLIFEAPIEYLIHEIERRFYVLEN